MTGGATSRIFLGDLDPVTISHGEADHPSATQNVKSLLTNLLLGTLYLEAVAGAATLPWWDNFPRMIITSDPGTAQAFSASAALNGVATDPGWGLWFTYATDSGAAGAAMRQSFQAAGIYSLSYNESYGDASCPIAELQWDVTQQRWTPRYSHWNWQLYDGGPIVWTGAWSWFDSFRNDPPLVPTEPSYFARPFTRMHSVYGGPPMTYPDGTIATGFFNNDSSDPRNSRVYDAGSSKDVFGHLEPAYGYNSNASSSNQPHAGEIWVPATGMFAGDVTFPKDSACPHWTNYAYASTLASAQLTGLQGTWTDNLGAWDSFMSGGPVTSAFGEWSVGRFRPYLTNHFTLSQLQGWGVLSNNATLADIGSFDVRAYFRTVASNQFGLASANLSDGAWNNSDWLDQPVWRAYKIFKRQVGTEALAAYDQAVHAAAAQGGQTNFALLVNDISPACFGWARGSFDLSSTELSLGWNLASGERGFGLPPFGRIAPLYKTMREHGRSRFAAVWLYTDGYNTALTNRGPVEAVFYEMLATHALPHIAPGDNHWAGTTQVQTNFLRFVAQTAAPTFTSRVPVEEVGIYFSSSSVLAGALPGDASNFSRQDHLFAMWGWGTVLSEMHYQYRIVPEWKLTRDLLLGLKLLIIPNAAAFDPDDVSTLLAWVQTDGGSLIVTGDSGSRLGEAGNFEPVVNLGLASLTGVTNYSTAPAAFTNHLGAGVVRFIKSNLGRSYYDATASGRTTLRPTLTSPLADGFTLLGAKPMLSSSNAPLTVGLTLYAGITNCKTFVDLNNLDVNATTLVTTPTPEMDVDITKPAWLNMDQPLQVAAISPQAVTLSAADLGANTIHLHLPSVTNYLSVVLYQTPAPPSITLQPASQTVLAGTPLTFKVTASGTGPLTYQWQFNGTNIPGATDRVFSLDQAGRANGGTYAVLVTNIYDKLLSSNATLTVQVPLQLEAPAILSDGTFELRSINSDGAPIATNQLTNYEALASSNLIGWTILSNALSWSNSALLLRDVEASNYSRRFYRLRER